MKNAIKVMWLSGRDMTENQLVALVNAMAWRDDTRTVDEYHRTAFRLDEDVNDVPVRAIISPLTLWELFLKLSKDKPVVVAQSKVFVSEDGTISDDADDYFILRWLETFEGDEEYIRFDDYEDD